MKLRVLPAVLAATAIATAAVMPSMVGATDTAAPAGPVGTGITGEYVGTIGLNGGFSPRLAEIAAEAGATGIGDAYMNFLYDLIGPLTITMDDGAMDGSWSMAGTGIIEGELSGGGMEIRIYGDGVYDGTGTLTGTPGNYQFGATFDSTATVTFDNPFTGPVSSTDSGIDTYSTALTSVAISCDQISGRWDYEINEDLEGINVDAFLNGYFTAVNAPGDAQDAVRDLTRDINAWSDRGTTDPAAAGNLLEAFVVLEIAQVLSAELVAAGGCVPPCDFTTPMNFAAADFAMNALAAEPGFTSSYLVMLLLGSGSLSDCDPALAEQLRQMLIDDLNLRIADLLADGAEQAANWERDVIDAARAAQMLGMETFGPDGIPPSDVLLVFGAGS